MSDGVSEYAWFRTPLNDIRGKPVGELRILRGFDDARQQHRRALHPHRPALAGGDHRWVSA